MINKLRQDEKDKIKKQNNKPNEETSEGFEVIGESEGTKLLNFIFC